MIRVLCDASGIANAARTVSEGGTVIYPTDTVYALGCDPYNAHAVSKVYRIKQRDRSKKMPVLCASPEAAWQLAEATPLQRRAVERFWPGALTVVAPLSDGRLRDSMALRDDTIAVRVPGGECVASILGVCGPLVGTSANVSGVAPVCDPDSIEIAGARTLIDGGVIAGGEASTVIELDGDKAPRIVREGAIRSADLEASWIS